MKFERKPRPKETGTLIGVRLQSPQLAELDAWIAGQPEPRPGRPEAIRRVLQDHFRKDEPEAPEVAEPSEAPRRRSLVVARGSKEPPVITKVIPLSDKERDRLFPNSGRTKKIKAQIEKIEDLKHAQWRQSIDHDVPDASSVKPARGIRKDT